MEEKKIHSRSIIKEKFPLLKKKQEMNILTKLTIFNDFLYFYNKLLQTY